jgi:acyl-CoA thioesterase-1
MTPRSLLGAAMLVTLATIGVAQAQGEPITLVMLGDDTLFGYGLLDPAKRMPARLQAQLASEGHVVEIVESPSVDSSKGAVIWLGTKSARAVLDSPANSAVILGVGHWDCTFLSLEQTTANLDKIIETFDGKGIPVLVVATEPRTFCGAAYNADYPSLFPALAERHGTLLHVDHSPPPPDERPEGVEYITEAVPLDNLLSPVRDLLALVEAQ